MPEQRVTLAEVARRAGVSRTTASFVMTGRRDMRISRDAEERVRQAARELNYRPNLLARSLRTNLSQTVGLISDVIATEPFAGEIVRGAVASALGHEHLLFMGESQGDETLETMLIQSMLDRGVGGFVYASMYTRETALSPILRAQKLVLLNCMTAAGDVPAVVPDEYEAGRDAVGALLKAGHSDQIVVVGAPVEPPSSAVLAERERLRGIRAALDELDLALSGAVMCEWWPGQTRAAVTTYLDANPLPSAFICLNDRVAFGVYQALEARRLGVPSDASVVSFDDTDLASWMHPGLTSVAIPHLEMGHLAVDLLLGSEPAEGLHRVPMPVHERGSIAPPA